jgi:hypothetical protein
MKPFTPHKGRGPLEGSMGVRFGETLTWYRRFWGQYYMFDYELDSYTITVFKLMYNPEAWQDEWIPVHHFDSATVSGWSKRPGARD